MMKARRIVVENFDEDETYRRATLRLVRGALYQFEAGVRTIIDHGRI